MCTLKYLLTYFLLSLLKSKEVELKVDLFFAINRDIKQGKER